MNKRSRGIAAMPVIYFGLIVATASLVAAGLIPEIPAWSLPLFAVVAVLGGVFAGNVKITDVVVTFVIVTLIFPIGLLYLIGVAGKLTTAETMALIATESGVVGWMMMLSPIGAAIVGYLAIGRLRKET
jgi:MFS family permease